jgi:hypothetical protein
VESTFVGQASEGLQLFDLLNGGNDADTTTNAA